MNALNDVFQDILFFPTFPTTASAQSKPTYLSWLKINMHFINKEFEQSTEKCLFWSPCWTHVLSTICTTAASLRSWVPFSRQSLCLADMPGKGFPEGNLFLTADAEHMFSVHHCITSTFYHSPILYHCYNEKECRQGWNEMHLANPNCKE